MYEISATIVHPKYGLIDIIAEIQVDYGGGDAKTSGDPDSCYDEQPATFTTGEAWIDDDDCPGDGERVDAGLIDASAWSEIEQKALELYRQY